jgi:hypothetical protein
MRRHFLGLRYSACSVPYWKAQFYFKSLDVIMTLIHETNNVEFEFAVRGVLNTAGASQNDQFVTRP